MSTLRSEEIGTVDAEPRHLWWGYRHTNGGVQAKRYFDDRASIEDAYESDFVADVVEPFPADSRDEALRIVSERTGGAK